MIIFRELNTNRAYIKSLDGLLDTLKFVGKLSVGIIKVVVAVQNWFVRCDC